MPLWMVFGSPAFPVWGRLRICDTSSPYRDDVDEDDEVDDDEVINDEVAVSISDVT